MSPGVAVRYTSVVRHVTDCAVRTGSFVFMIENMLCVPRGAGGGGDGSIDHPQQVFKLLDGLISPDCLVWESVFLFAKENMPWMLMRAIFFETVVLNNQDKILIWMDFRTFLFNLVNWRISLFLI